MVRFDGLEEMRRVSARSSFASFDRVSAPGDGARRLGVDIYFYRLMAYEVGYDIMAHGV